MLFMRSLRGLVDQLAAQVRQFASLAAEIRSDLKTMSDALDAKIAALQADVAALTSVGQSATALLNGLSSQLSAALSSAKAAGLTDTQAQDLDALDQALKGQAASLSAAVAANTVADPAGE